MCVCVLCLYIQVCVYLFCVSVCFLCQPVCLCVYVVCTPLIYVCLCCVCQCVCLYFCQCVCLSICLCCVYVCLILSANDYGVLALCQKYNIPWWKVPHYEMRTQCALCITEEERHGKRYLTNCFCRGLGR